MNKSLIIFDMDGTLIDSSRAIANAINYVRDKLYLPPMPSAEIVEKINDQSLNPAKFFYKSDRFERDHERWFSEYYSRHHQRELQLYDGIPELLQTLSARGTRLAVATNAYRLSTIESLKHLDIYGYFDAVASFDDVERGKPYPDMLEKILEAVDAERSEALFIGDGSRDEMAAKNAGIDYLMVNWGFSEHKEAIRSVASLRERIVPTAG